MRVKITIWADPHQIERMAKSGVLSPSKSDRIWMSTVREIVKEAGFDLAIETGPRFRRLSQLGPDDGQSHCQVHRPRKRTPRLQGIGGDVSRRLQVQRRPMWLQYAWT